MRGKTVLFGRDRPRRSRGFILLLKVMRQIERRPRRELLAKQGMRSQTGRGSAAPRKRAAA